MAHVYHLLSQEQLMNKNKPIIKKGFTLAEILLTMAIIGVVMALLIRTVARVDPDKDKFLFLKSYHAIEEIIRSSVNDYTKYDQNIYADGNIDESMGELHLDLSYAPLPSAKIEYIDAGTKKTACPSKNSANITCDSDLKQENAVCYYIAEHINTIGAVNCSNNADVNIKSSIGVCFRGLVDETKKGTYEIEIDPSCLGKDKGYKVKIFKDGRVTVPKTSKKAYEWIKNPTAVK